ncbi:MAG: hypothetical protein ABFR36_02640 [Acidobacteriota bacterium]
MEFTLDFDNMPDFVLLRTSGAASVEGFRAMIKILLESPEWITGTPQIADHRKLDVTVFVPDDLRAVQEMIVGFSEELGAGSCAFVMGDELGFGFARMYELLGGDSVHGNVEVFYSFRDALIWTKNSK